MSYFVVICGEIACLNAGKGKIVPAGETQPYVLRAINGIVDAETASSICGMTKRRALRLT